MQIKLGCPDCEQTGIFTTHTPYGPPTQIPYVLCNGLGYLLKETIICPEFDTVNEKLEEIKTKQNRMQADINYIKAKVG